MVQRSYFHQENDAMMPLFKYPPKKDIPSLNGYERVGILFAFFGSMDCFWVLVGYVFNAICSTWELEPSFCMVVAAFRSCTFAVWMVFVRCWSCKLAFCAILGPQACIVAGVCNMRGICFCLCFAVVVVAAAGVVVVVVVVVGFVVFVVFVVI